MKGILVLAGMLYLLPFTGRAQPSLATDYFRSSATGYWDAPATWQSSHDNVTYFTATSAPASTAQNIVIQNLNTVTINSSGISLIRTTVQSGGILEFTSAASYTIDDDAGDDLVVEGGGILLLNFATATTPAAPGGTGTVLIKTGGKVIANTVINTAGLTALALNYVSSSSRFSYGDKAIFEWRIANFILPSTASAGYFKTAAAGNLPVFRITTAPVVSFGSSTDNLFNCTLEVNAPFNIAGSGIKTFVGGLTGTSTITQTAGTIALPNSTSVLDGLLTINTINTGLRLVNGAIIPAGANIVINTPAENDAISKQAGNLQVNGTLDVTHCKINNTGSLANVTIAGTGILKTSNTAGFSGTSATIVSGAITLDANSTIEFNNTGNQNFESRPDFKNLIFSGSGIKKPGSGFDPVGTIKITGTATLDCTGFNMGDGSNNGNLTMDGGRLIVSTVSPLATQPGLGGVYNLTGGVIQFNGSAVTTQAIRSKAYQNIEVTGTNVGNSNSNITLKDLGTFTVKNGATFTINDNTITGPSGMQTITIESGGTFNTGNNQGFSGFTASLADNSSIHSNIENILLASGSNVIYSRNGDQPITNSGGLAYQNLTVSGSSGNKTAPSGILTIQGNFTKNNASIFVHNSGTVIFNNSISAQDYNCVSVPPVTFYNLTNGNIFNGGTGLNINGNMRIINLLALSAGSKLNLLSGDITLVSDATNTARTGVIPANAVISYGTTTGRFIVERYYPNTNPVTHRAWRLITTPLSEAADIFDTWQLSGAVYGAANQHSGTLITGPQVAGNGLDYTPTNNYSLKEYNGTNFSNVSNTHVSLTPLTGKGYFLFVRGDRNPILTSAANSDYTTLSGKGKLLTGAIPINVPDNFTLIGNPYSSPVNFATLLKNNVNTHRFYVWDPTLNSVGGYVVMEDAGTPGTFTPTAPFAGSSQDNYIQSSQAFFVEKLGAGVANIGFAEGAKTSNYNPFIFRQAGEQGISGYIRANLYLLNADSSRIAADGCSAQFDNLYSDAIDIDDALKFGNINEAVYWLRYNKKLAVERRPTLTEKDTMFCQLIHSTQRNYQFELAINLNEPGLAGYWEDSYKKSSVQVNLAAVTRINFIVNADSASFAADRFRLVFKKVLVTLPLIIRDFQSYRKDDNILVSWTIENESGLIKYEIEQSEDGRNFNLINTTVAMHSSGIITYKWLQAPAPAGVNFLRIKCMMDDGTAFYSNTVKVEANDGKSNILIFPDPVTDGIIRLSLINKPKGVYKYKLLNNTGQELHKGSFIHEGRSMPHTLIPGFTRLSGTFYLKIIAPGKTSSIHKILINN